MALAPVPPVDRNSAFSNSLRGNYAELYDNPTLYALGGEHDERDGCERA